MGLNWLQKIISYFLRMVRLTYARTEACSVAIVRSVFEIQCEIFRKFSDIRFHDQGNSDLVKAHQDNNFRAYLKAVWRIT